MLAGLLVIACAALSSSASAEDPPDPSAEPAQVAVPVSLALPAVPPIGRGLRVGANDDTGKFADDSGGGFYGRMAGLGLRQTILTVRFRPSTPDVIQDRAFLDTAVPTALANGIRVVLAVYPYPPKEIESRLATPEQFARYVTTLVKRYPGVRQIIVGNEPNQTAFWRPQLNREGANVSARRFGPFLAAAYDAAKSVDSQLTVVGVGLSPRGNDNGAALSNVSTSPVRFVSALGRWYRSTGRSKPLMDGFSYHPYPLSARDPLLRAYAWPNAGFADLPRIKQALWDAFSGTSQPVPGSGLRLYLDEVGWQVDTAQTPGYTGKENVPVTSEKRQAAIYSALVRAAACDPDIAEVNFFGFYDDPARTAGFQAALHRVDGSARPSAAAVATAIKGGCAKRAARWRPATRVVGASLSPVERLRSGTLRVLVGAEEGAGAVVCLLPSDESRTIAVVGRTITRNAITRCWRGTVTPRTRVQVKLPVPPGWHGRVTVATIIQAEANRSRATLLTAAP